jgi:hypothetical protein
MARIKAPRTTARTYHLAGQGSKLGISTPDVAEVPERRSKFVGICLMKL